METVKYLVEIQISPMFPVLKDGTRTVAYEEIVCTKVDTRYGKIPPFIIGLKAFYQFEDRLDYKPNFRKELEAKGFYDLD